MKIYDFNYNNKEYTLVDIYNVDNRRVIQLNSDDDIILFQLNADGNISRLTENEEKKFRQEHYLVDYGYVTASINDLMNGEFHAKKVDENEVELFKKSFVQRLLSVNSGLLDSKYINKRLESLKYKEQSKLNAYALDTVYIVGKFPKRTDDWVVTHETVHAIVNKSRITSMGIIEGITDNMVGKILPNGNYSQNCQLQGGKIQINDSGQGQKYLVTFAKQLEYALGDEYNDYEMLTIPHEQIKKFGQLYGSSKCRILNHKINNLYHDGTIENYKIAQEYMLEMIFDKKIELVNDGETAKNYFQELINFGLLRGRINGKDEDLAKYYAKQKEVLVERGIDVSNIPNYSEKPFYPCGDCYLRYNHYLKASIKARKEGKGECFQILYNKDNTCVYIIIDGELKLIQNDSVDRKRMFNSNEINSANSKVVSLENGYYLITGPDGITEEVRDTNSSKIIDNYFEKMNSKSR